MKQTSLIVLIIDGSTAKAEQSPSILDSTARVLEDIRGKSVEKLLVDLRFNGGGSSPQRTEFAKKIGKVAGIDRKSRLFSMIGKRTYSSAVINAMNFKKFAEAILIGEPTSGRPLPLRCCVLCGPGHHLLEVSHFRENTANSRRCMPREPHILSTSGSLA